METKRRPSIAYSRPDRPKISLLFLAAVSMAALVGVTLYWPTLDLPLLYDDLLHIRIAKGLDLASVWLPTEAFGFYRPLTFLPLLIIRNIFGHYPAPLLHGINVAQHALNVMLLGWLSWRLWKRLHWVLASGLLLALFPFSYQAIAVYGHNVHPATANLLLLALHTYLTAIRSRNRAGFWWLLTVLLFLLGLLSHESAILFGAFAALVQWNDSGKPLQLVPLPRSWSRSILTAPRDMRQSFLHQPWLFFLIVGAFYLVGYQLLPLSRAPQATFGGTALGYKLLYLLQAATYPFAWFGQWFPDGSAPIVVLTGLTLVLGLTVWSASEPENRLPLLMGWGWWGLASLLIAIPLSATYLLHGPRLLYLGSVGLALLWPVLLEPIYRLSRFGRPLWAVALTFVLLTNWFFVRDRLDAYARLTSPLGIAETVMAEQPVLEGILWVNLPQWLAPADSVYPVGVELVAMLGNYLFVEELMAENLGQDHPVQAIQVPDLLSDTGYSYAIHQQPVKSAGEADWSPAGSHVFIVTYTEAGPQTRYTGSSGPAKSDNLPLANLHPFDLLKAEAVHCGETVRVSTSWRYSESITEADSIPPTLTMFAQLLDQEGRLVASADGPLLGLRPDLLSPSSGRQLNDERRIQMQGDRGEVVVIGLYDYITGERLLASDAKGVPLADDAFSLPLLACP